MDPTGAPPWRVLESATESGKAPQPATPPPESGITPSVVKAIAMGAAAAALAIAAFVLATSGDGGTVIVDGGTSLSVDDGSGGASGVPLAGGELVVEIVGAVPKPGVYRLPSGSRVVDLVERAGGYGPRVDTAAAETRLNLAAPLRDGDQIRVPSRDDVATGGASPGAGSAGGSGAALIDLNRASQTELESLPGVGPATAEKIIAARDEAPFATVDELRSRGILGEKTFEKLRDLVTVG